MKIKAPYNKDWKYYWGNQHLHYLNKDAPMIADDCIRSCEGCDVNPWVMVAVACVTSENFQAAPLDYFGVGLEGPLEDQIINASLHYINLQDTTELKITAAQAQQVDLVYQDFARYLESMAKNAKPKPLPQPPLPEPEPEPIPPAKPPKPTPVELPPKKEDPALPAKPGAWKITLAKVVGVLGAAGFIVKLFLPGAFASAYDLVLKILGLILGS